MYSMTGFGKSEKTENEVSVSVEIKTVNNRNLDISVKAPRILNAYEESVRKTVREFLSRGRVDVFINVKDRRENKGSVSVDYSVASGFVTAAKELSEKFSLTNDFTVSALMRAPDVIIYDEQEAEDDFLEDLLISAVKEALESLNAMRKREGEKLVVDISSRMEVISSLVSSLEEKAPLVAEDYRVKLKERITEILGDVKYDEARLLNEVAFFADKSNIDEEITRLKSHIVQFYSLIKKDGTGKQIDFLIQEFNRESNTVCSKANDLKVTDIGLSLKCEIEKIREQIQNLE